MNSVIPAIESDEIIFCEEEDEADNEREGEEGRWKIALIDDEPDVHQVTQLSMRHHHYQGRSFEFVHAYSAEEGRQLLAEHSDIALILLDVVMESEDSGLQLVNYIRNELDNQVVQIVLRTGQAGIAPSQDVIVRFNINNYYEKQHLTRDRLFTSIVSSLRAFSLHEQAIYKSMEAEQANLSKSLFMANVSHEMRTPLHAILSFANIGMEHSGGNEQEKRYFSYIHESGKRLLIMVENLLNVSKLESGYIDLNIQPVEMVTIVDNARSALSSTMQRKSVNVLVHTANTPLIVEIDSEKIERVIINLLSNAVRFSPHGATVTIILSDKSLGGLDNSQEISVAVIDEGIGIPAGEEELIFRPFTKSSDSHSQANGLGLGLALSRELIRLHGGSIKAANRHDGQGAIFNFTLPKKQPRLSIGE
ncbi:response regulator [Ectothiorhodospiraceae bacterium BW-2]|nr:response regulator [Ectothiorhodospiraceae bacterium BW-2]